MALYVCNTPCKLLAENAGNLWIASINKLTVDDSRSEQIMLWKVYHLLQEVVLQKSWTRVKNELDRYGVSCQEGNSAADPVFYRCLFKKAAFLDSDKHPYDLYFDVLVSAKNDRVLSVEPHLVSQVNEPFAEVFKGCGGVEENSVLKRVIGLSDAKDEAEEYSYLQAIDISYQSLRRRNFNYECSGFVVALSLRTDKGVSKIVSYSTASGLDPCTDNTNNIKDAFVPKDILIDDIHNAPALPEQKYKPVFRKTS